MGIKNCLIVLFFLGVFPLSFCAPEYPYYTIEHISLDAYKDKAFTKRQAATDSIFKDTVYIQLKLGTSFTAQNLDFSFANTCFATTKPSNGYKGLRDKIIDIQFTSDQTFNGRIAETNINTILNTSFIYRASDFEEFEIRLNDGPPSYYARTGKDLILYITEKPKDNLSHNFTLKFIFESGKILSGNLSLVWK